MLFKRGLVDRLMNLRENAISYQLTGIGGAIDVLTQKLQEYGYGDYRVVDISYDEDLTSIILRTPEGENCGIVLSIEKDNRGQKYLTIFSSCSDEFQELENVTPATYETAYGDVVDMRDGSWMTRDFIDALVSMTRLEEALDEFGYDVYAKDDDEEEEEPNIELDDDSDNSEDDDDWLDDDWLDDDSEDDEDLSDDDDDEWLDDEDTEDDDDWLEDDDEDIDDEEKNESVKKQRRAPTIDISEALRSPDVPLAEKYKLIAESTKSSAKKRKPLVEGEVPFGYLPARKQRKKVIRDGKIVVLKPRPMRKKKRLNTKQKLALVKARRKARSAAAKRARAKAMLRRKMLHLK